MLSDEQMDREIREHVERTSSDSAGRLPDNGTESD